ncbi:DsbA family protein [Sedimentitalea sp. XS_ASV28]|uniref:DsbA family protein n=1 Tax=Sedimentitalea sp. XS_ASV28 TaxID=3241296 RepID=UPI003517A226
MIRFAAPALTAVALFAGSASAADLTDLTEAERAAFRDEVRAYLMDNPEVIIEAVDLLKERNAEQQAQADVALVEDNADALFNDGYSWVGGNPDGDITLVEFMDYRCGYCRRAKPEVDKLLAADGNIRLIIKEFPILGDASVASSRFAIATRKVAGDEAYEQVHDALMELDGDVNDVILGRLAEGLGLDSAAILARMNDDDITAEIAETRALAQRLQISGTPTFVLEDELLRGYLPADQLEIIVSEKRDG